VTSSSGTTNGPHLPLFSATRGSRRDGSVPVRAAWFAFSGDAGDLFYTQEDPRVCRWSRIGGEICWQTVFRPLAVIPTGDRRSYLASYRRIADASWPESWPMPPAEPTINWPRFWLWVGAAASAAGLLLFSRWPRGRTADPRQRRTGDKDSSVADSGPAGSASTPAAPCWQPFLWKPGAAWDCTKEISTGQAHCGKFPI
jgi:hypothetical protein